MAPKMISTATTRMNAGCGAEPAPGHRAHVGAKAGGVFGRLFDMLARWAERRRQRLALYALDDNMLHDIGLSRADVEAEATKPFWMI